MDQTVTIESLRAALRSAPSQENQSADARFLSAARRYENALAALASMVRRVVDQVPELTCILEDEVETFTSPAFPGKATQIRDRRIRIARDENMLLFDPSATAYLSALGQVEIKASRPIPFLIEKVLYLIPERGGEGGYWAFRSAHSPGAALTPFTEEVFIRMLGCAFA